MNRTSRLALAVVGAVGAGAAWLATDGLAAFTTEGVRRLAVAENPRPLPDVAFEDQDGRRLSFDDLRGRVVLVEFIYTRCPTLCTRLGEAFARSRDSFAREIRDGGLVMASISFDPVNDDVAALAAYARSHGADGQGWRILRPVEAGRLQELLDRFGVVTIPDPWGGWEHNAAVHLIDRGGRLARVFDFAPQAAVEREVRPWLSD